ncbi:MAG: DUF4288 domain-containing protein [Anaerolineae bacterium]|nr:DUF4288 domain-containing protein [Anaerolineae bacterium]
MGYIPSDAKWYLAEIVQEMLIEGESDTVVDVNFNLVRADSPDEAYQKAVELGRNGESTYENTDGKEVRVVFRGLRDLNVIHDELEHGAELIYERKVGLTQAQVQTLSTPKEQLGVFQPITPDLEPNLMPLDVARKLDEHLKSTSSRIGS